MPTFAYTARNAQGKTISGSSTAANRQEALSELRDRGLTILTMDAVPDLPGKGAPRTPWNLSFATKSSKIRLSDMAVFCRQLAVAISAGVALRDALELITDDLENAALRRVLKRTITRLNDGMPFSEALEAESVIFGPMFIGLMRVAEEAGGLPETLNQLADYMERNERLIRRFYSMTMYPIFIGGFFIIVCIVMTLFIVPQFRTIFAGREAALPHLTTIVFNANRFILDHLAGVSLAVAGLVVGLVIIFRSTGGRAVVDRLKLRLPILGKCFRKIAIARVCRNLGLMLRSGVSVTTGLEVSSAISGNLHIAKSLLQARDRILTGADISSSLGSDPEFPKLVVRMVAVGESSGRLPEVFDRIADTYDNQAEATITVASTLLEPLLICFFGGIILLLVLAIYLPVFTISSAAQ